MPISRHDQFLPNDYSFQVYQPQDFSPDFSSLDALLGGLQKEYDVGNSTLNRISPNYLRQSESDTQAAKAFRQKYDGLIKQSTDAFANGNISEGRRLMSGALREVEKDQLPGGDYYGLEQRVGEFKAIKDEYLKRFKDAPGEYLNEALSRIDLGQFRDPVTGEIGSIKDPNIGVYVNIGEELDKRLNGFKADKGTIIKIGDKWVYEESKEQVSPDEIQRASGKILNEPRFKQQLGIEADIYSRGLTDDDVAAYNKASLDAGLSLPPRELQKKLKKEGFYSGAIDGSIGPQTLKAIDDYKKSSKGAFGSARELAGVKVIENYVSPMVDKYAYTQVDKNVKANQFSLEKEKIDYMNYNPFAGITIPGREQQTQNHNYSNVKDIEGKNKMLQGSIENKLANLAQEAGISNGRSLFNLSDEALAARGISPEKVRQVQYQTEQAEKQIGINNQIKQDALDVATKKFGKDKELLYQQGMNRVESALPEILKTTAKFENGEQVVDQAEIIAAIKSGKWGSNGSQIILQNEDGSVKGRLTGKAKEAFDQANIEYRKIGGQVKAFESEVDGYIENTQKGKVYQPELFTSVVIRDEKGEVNSTATANATKFMQEFVSNPTNIARYKYIDKDGKEMYYQFKDFADDLPKDKDGQIDFKQMQLSFSGATTDPNPAFGTASFELSYVNDDAENKSLHAPVPKELAEKIIYPGGRKPDDGLMEGNTGWNLAQQASWQANTNIQEALYQAGSKYPTSEGTFYMDKHPATGKPISSDDQFIFKTNDGEELAPNEYRQYIIGLNLQKAFSK